MESTEDTEMELKYLIKGKENSPDEDIFRRILQETRHLEKIHDYYMAVATPKKRNYRYFDTFDTKLAEKEIFTYIGPLEQEGISMSAREREHDYVLTVKFPTADLEKREEFEFRIPAGTEFYELQPDDFQFWGPLKRAKQAGRNMSLQEVIRLEVETHRFNLEQENELKVQLALDQVTAMGPFNIQKRFYELEIERMYGSERDLERVSSFFIDTYKDNLKLAPQAKWIKALELIRGREPKIIESL